MFLSQMIVFGYLLRLRLRKRKFPPIAYFEAFSPHRAFVFCVGLGCVIPAQAWAGFTQASPPIFLQICNIQFPSSEFPIH